jgi:hypothetical protein
VNTGVQHLVRDLDEMPEPDAGFRLLEPPHRRIRLRPLIASDGGHRLHRLSAPTDVSSTAPTVPSPP